MLPVKVTTNHTVDTSSLDAIVADLIRPTMSDEEKALVLWEWLSQTIYHYGWPYMRPHKEEHWQDPIKVINVHGYGLCGTHGRVLGRLFGRVFGDENTRLIGLTESTPGAWRLDEGFGAFIDTGLLRDLDVSKPAGHSSVEVRYGGRWRLLDSHVKFIAYLRGDQGIAGAEDLIADPSLVTHPVRRVDGLMPCGDLSRVFYKSTFINWGTLTREAAPDDHSMGVALRRGETYTRHWDRKASFRWFAEMDRRWDPEYISPGPRHICASETAWRHYGNGELVYRPRLTDESYRDGVLEERGVASSARRGLVAARAGRRGQVIFSVRAPYMLVAAQLDLHATRTTGSDSLEVRVRPVGGAWTPVWLESECGRLRRKLDLSPWVGGTYGYDIRFDLKGARNAEHAVVHRLTLRTQFILNYLALPRLMPGSNRVTVSAGDAAQLDDRPLEVTYAWADRQGEHEHRRTITAIPDTYAIEVAPLSTLPPENPKYMRFIRIAVP